MDDSTSSVDMETEYFIQLALAELPAGRTTFIIAHRLQSLQMSDLILVVKEGRLVERGEHEKLHPKVCIARSIICNSRHRSSIDRAIPFR
jgi:ABC-type multidrug transport system fused ATPase/permease subunit